MDSAALDDLKVDVNAVLTSGGGKLPERKFLSDYKSLTGNFVPYKQLGFNDLRSCLESLGFYYTREGNEAVINAGYNEKTAHITKLIANQKKRPVKRQSSTRRLPLRRLTHLKSASFRAPAPLRAPPHRAPPLRAPAAVSRAPPPKPKYGNPPIIPQRQPLLPSVQSRLDISSKPFTPTVLESSVEDPVPSLPTPTTNSNKNSESPPPKKSAQDRLTNITESRFSKVDIKAAHSAVASGSTPVSNSSLPAARTDNDQKASKPSSTDIEVPKTSPPDAFIPPLMGVQLPIASPPVGAIPPLMGIQLPHAQQFVPAPIITPPIQPFVPPTSLSSSGDEPKKKSRSRLKKVTFSSHIEELNSLVQNLGLSEPEFKLIERRPSKGKPLYVAKLKIGQDGSYSSYPEEKPTAEEARELVAKYACEQLRKRYLFSTSEDIEETELEERLLKIVEGKSNGIFVDAIALEYEKEFMSAPPSTWTTVLENSSKFTLEKCSETRSIVYPKSLSEVNDSLSISSGSPPPSPVSPPVVSSPESPRPVSPVVPPVENSKYTDINANNVPCNKINKRLPDLELPCDRTWDVFVTCNVDCDVWVRLIGEQYDEKYNDVINHLEMQMLNSSNSQTVQFPIIDQVYALLYDNNWLRVQVKEIMEDKCVVFLIDHGEYDTASISDLRVLDDRYLALPPQAVQCRLAYVDLAYEEAQNFFVTQVVGKTLVAEIISFSEGVPSIVLHNTEFDDPVNVNCLILEEVVKKLVAPQISQRNISLLRVTHIAPGVSPYVQLEGDPGRDLKLLNGILECLALQDLVSVHGVNAHPRINQLLNPDHHLFVARSMRAPTTWRRCRLINTDDKRSPLVNFVDYGYEEKVGICNIFDLDKVFPLLSKIPIQAFQLNLRDLEPHLLTAGVVKRFEELVTPETLLIARVTDSSTDIPTVELSKRVQPENILCSINSDLRFHCYDSSSCEQKIEEEISSSPLRGQPSSRCTQPLPAFSWSSCGDEYLDIFVVLSSNPFNFLVQPVKILNSVFNEMMRNMQDLYNSQHHIMPIPVTEELVGNATFAVKHPEDEQWYRVSVVKVVDEATVSVRYSDYGDIAFVEVDRLRYLEPRFRLVPALATRARLHGVKPKSIDWSVEECVYFNNLVDKKPFVSKVISTNPDSSLNTWKFSLQLLDTSGDEDLDIAKLLIEGDMAEVADVVM